MEITDSVLIIPLCFPFSKAIFSPNYSVILALVLKLGLIFFILVVEGIN